MLMKNRGVLIKFNFITIKSNKINCDIKELFINQKDSRIYATSIQNDDIYYFDINDIMEGTKTN